MRYLILRLGVPPLRCRASRRALQCESHPLRVSVADAYGLDSLIWACALFLRAVSARRCRMQCSVVSVGKPTTTAPYAGSSWSCRLAHRSMRRSASPACSLARACCCAPRATRPCAPCWNASTPLRCWASCLSPSHPRTGARSPIGSLRACRCLTTPPSGTPPGWPGGRCRDRRFHHRYRTAFSFALARSRRTGGPVCLWPCCAGLGVLRVSSAARYIQPDRQ